MDLSPSAHLDTFPRESLPPQEFWPILEYTLPELRYPARLNAGSVLIDEGVARFGADRIALRTPAGVTWSYGELQGHADRIARVLTEDLGLVPGNRVLLRMPNTPEAVACWLAVLKAGLVVITTMVAWKAPELRAVAERTLPQAVLVDGRHLDDIDGAFDPRVAIRVVGGPDDDLLTAAAEKPAGFTAVDTAADDVALLGPTSGTTGLPKVTMHFHRDILANADTFARYTLRLRPDDVCAGTAPLAFTFGLGGLVVFPLRFGASSLMTERSGPVQLAEMIDRCGITVLYTAPTGYRAVVKEGRADALRRLRVAVSAGEHLPLETFELIEREAGVRLINGLGATELLHVFISAAGEEIRPGATGKAVPGFRATILDEDGNEAPNGATGRLAVIGPTGCRYMNDDRQQDYVCRGWNITGDAFLRDDDGYFFYQARSDSMIIASGYNVGAPEVEAAIDCHPDVLESGVVGRPDPEKGTIINAFVVLRPGTPADESTREAIKQTVQARLAIYKCPRRIDFVDELPRNPSGKLQHFRLRERAEQDAASETIGAFNGGNPA